MHALFDIDGVLVEPYRFRDLLESVYGIGPDTTRTFFQTRFPLCLAGEADLLEELPPFLESWSWPSSLEDFVRIWFEIENAPVAAVFEFVAALRADGWRCHVASNQERRRATYLTEVMGFGSRFDTLFFSWDLGVCKPDPTYFEKIETTLESPGSRLVFVDDSERNVAAARERGWRAVRFDNLESLRDVAAVVDSAAS